MDIFNEPEFEENPVKDEIAKESQKIQKEIKTILSQVVINNFSFYFVTIKIFRNVQNI